jgi:hypothetical protein
MLRVPIKGKREFTVSVEMTLDPYLNKLYGGIDKLKAPKANNEEVQYEFLYQVN